MKKFNPEFEIPREPLQNLKTLLTPLLWASLILAVTGLYIFQNASMTHLRRQIRKLSYEGKKVIKKNSELKITVMKHSSMERIEKLYRLKYGYLPVSTSFRIKTLQLAPSQTSSTKHTASLSMNTK